jgi:hypothetical protein
LEEEHGEQAENHQTDDGLKQQAAGVEFQAKSLKRLGGGVLRCFFCI